MGEGVAGLVRARGLAVKLLERLERLRHRRETLSSSGPSRDADRVFSWLPFVSPFPDFSAVSKPIFAND